MHIRYDGITERLQLTEQVCPHDGMILPQIVGHSGGFVPHMRGSVITCIGLTSAKMY